ncbi:MAG: hypothetical protein ACR2OH_09220, partial [Microthrixaceae bacterium]
VSTPSVIDLGTTEFDVPTSSPGVFQLQMDPATLAVSTSPEDLSATATCTDGGYSELPVGFVVDPLAPVIDPPSQTVEADGQARQSTVMLSDRVTEGPGPIVEDSWRIVRTSGPGQVETAVDSGMLSYDVSGGPADIVWEVCGLSSPPSPSTTTSTTTTLLDDDAQVELAAETEVLDVESPRTEDEAADATSNAPATAQPTEDPTMHCAQGLLQIRPNAGTQVLSAVSGSGGNSTTSTATPSTATPTTGTSATGTSGGAALSVTG